MAEASKKQEFYTGVDLAVPSDFEAIVDLALDYYDNVEEVFPKPDIGKLATNLGIAFVKHPVFVYKVNDEIVGVVVLHEMEPWWSTESYFQDLIFYVKKEHRSYKIAKNRVFYKSYT